ncbi:hypothetical protein Tco_1251383, partial [Tanacetum coccineum]
MMRTNRTKHVELVLTHKEPSLASTHDWDSLDLQTRL